MENSVSMMATNETATVYIVFEWPSFDSSVKWQARKLIR
jgi:hypothetical protein